MTWSSEPAATILSPSTATAVAVGLSRSMVTIFLATKIVTGGIARPEASVSVERAVGERRPHHCLGDKRARRRRRRGAQELNAAI